MDKASLTAYKPPIGNQKEPVTTTKKLPLQYNPTQLTLVKETEWARHSTRLAPHTPVSEFLGSQPRILTMSLVFDEDTPDGSTVNDRVATLTTWCEPDKAALDANESSPPWLKLTWGKVSTAEFWMVLKRLSVQYTRFSTDGRALRAQCDLVLEEVGV
ncbi:CIS tube protein [Streptomyces sp. NPDC055709]